MPEAFISITTSPGPGAGSGKLRTSILRLPRKTAPRILPPNQGQTTFLSTPLIALLAHAQDLVWVALPPVELGEDLDLVKARVARAFDPGADARQVDHAVPHHAAVVEQIARRHQPVADVVGEDALAGSLDLLLQLRIPPDVVDVHRGANSIPEQFAKIQSLFQRIDARALGRLHGMQRLDRQRHAGLSRFRKDCRNAFPYLFS